ncbi:DHHW family protein [Caproiciproducens sp. MSJ-32]|uniref:DHHW family protein n=1 Tax=Caproiciproducens sp. MSJ-32 TaxID=2841527 RepID=UPI00256FE141|nr:DHHW family protein [Caproiciproducens sp. MSJ-32]
MNKKNLEGFANKMNSIYQKHLKGMKVYYSIIPDKNYYLSSNEYLTLDYDYLFNYIKSNLNNMEYIDITNYLNIDSYYNTDLHWRQDKLIPIVKLLSEKMNFKINDVNYTKNTYYPFYGSYYGYTAINIKADTLTYLNNSTIDAAIVKNYNNSISSVYNLDKLDSYDVFLSGATPFIEITNTNNKSGKELIIFRDSFGSSLAPLLIDRYYKITLIDLRYISPSLLETIIKFNNQDILILYNTLIINNSSIIKN